MNFYVYALLDPTKQGQYSYRLSKNRVAKFEYEPFYIGKGNGGRAEWHIPSAVRGSRSHKSARIRKILRLNEQVIIKKSRALYDEFLNQGDK